MGKKGDDDFKKRIRGWSMRGNWAARVFSGINQKRYTEGIVTEQDYITP